MKAAFISVQSSIVKLTIKSLHVSKNVDESVLLSASSISPFFLMIKVTYIFQW